MTVRRGAPGSDLEEKGFTLKAGTRRIMVLPRGWRVVGTREEFVCTGCGRGVRVDEDGCCAGCGADTTVETREGTE